MEILGNSTWNYSLNVCSGAQTSVKLSGRKVGLIRLIKLRRGFKSIKIYLKVKLVCSVGHLKSNSVNIKYVKLDRRERKKLEKLKKNLQMKKY